MSRFLLTGARVFDGTTLHDGLSVAVEGETLHALVPGSLAGWDEIALPGGILAPGFVDLQVNGGGGVMVDGTATPASLAALADVHARLGATTILPTLITDTPKATRAVLDAALRTPGLAGLHLEGPHLDPQRRGAHDGALIRPLSAEDLSELCHAARHLNRLIVTLAPNRVTPEQIAMLSAAGVIVSLGHSDCSYDQAMAARRAGARMVTHLFNAMSPLASREPGLTGAALTGDFDVGLIADGVHVHPQTMAIALAAKRAGRVFLVSDAMAVAGTKDKSFRLGGREILRQDGRLTLQDGTLAGADLTLPRAARVLVTEVGLPVEQALAMASRLPAEAVGLADRHGCLMPGRVADLVHLTDELTLRAVWRRGRRIG